ncbi:hypothetical protein AC1031_012921 [Aphanomyces cochlioides]|nr:hypothetical protein AC1031_012921 [Aphanomyces cochlioides]
MQRENSSEDDVQRDDHDRSRSRDRAEQPRGRQVRREVTNPFRSPRRRQPRPVDEWLPSRGPYSIPLPYDPQSYDEPPVRNVDEPSAVPLPPDDEATGEAEGHVETDGPKEQVHADTDMGSDGGYGRGFQVLNAPAIPQPPTFSGSTKTERREFMRAYEKYVGQINALQSTGSRPFAMPVSACIEPSTKRYIAMWDYQRDYNAISEDEWTMWFKAAFDEDPQDFYVLKKRLQSAIRFDMRILDAESRVGRMLHDMTRALERDRQEWVLHQEGKMVVEIITKALKPESLKTAVVKQLQLQRNKPLKNDVFRFVSWLRAFAAGHQMFVGLEDDGKSAKTNDDKGGPNGGKGELGRQNGRGDQR